MLTRRRFTKTTIALGVSAVTADSLCQDPAPSSREIIRRRIGKTKHTIPAIGMGTWRTFDVGDDQHARRKRVEVLEKFFNYGGTVIDSSPMYGTSQVVIGHCLETLTKQDKNKQPPPVFSASKVWTPGRSFGIRQMNNSADLWGIDKFDLMQVHNLLDWETHLETLQQDKADGKVKYIGVTTSHGRRHDKLAALMQTEAIDFIQLTYNIVDREAEKKLLPMALERGISVIANRPFQGSLLFDRVRDKSLPAYAKEFGCENWAQFLLKFVISHRAITCAIPATSRVDHMQENMGALTGELPDPKARQKMVRLYEELAS